MRSVPDHLREGPVRRNDVLAADVSRDVLEGVQFQRLHQGVHVHRDHHMAWSDHVEAARLALPDGARTTGATRLRQLGLEVGQPFPLHFVVEGDLHLALRGVFLHRTVKMPPHDEDGVSTEAAFVAFCAESRTIDAIKAGSMLLHLEKMDLAHLDQLMTEEQWRRGVAEAAYVLPFLDARCRSLQEAELLSYVVFSGMPLPEVNEKVTLADSTELTPDLWFEDYGLAVEYEGSHHQNDRGQYNADIDRYAAYRRNKTPYEQVTKERMRSPRATVRMVYRALVACGYDGPEPDFDGAWPLLFARLTDVVRLHRTT